MMNAAVLTGLKTMLRKDIGRILRIWSQTLLPPVVTTTLYYLIFGAFIGSQVAPIDGYSYMQFIVPGLVMMTVITSAYMNTVSTFYFAKWTHTLDELLVSPMPSWGIVLGFTLGGVARASMVAVLVVLVSLFFTGLTITVTSLVILLGAMLLTAILFSLAGLLNGMFAKSFDAVNIVPTFVLTPLTYLGGVFYSIDQLPPFFRAISLANPILYMVNAFRYGFLGISDVPVGTAFGVMAGLIVVLLACVLWLFRKGAGIRN
jgi:ABC-2 type transport system permease protein